MFVKDEMRLNHLASRVACAWYGVGRQSLDIFNTTSTENETEAKLTKY
jgi:hypothetical protein